MSANLYKGNFKGLLFYKCYRIAHWCISSKVRKLFLSPIWISYRFLFNWLLGIDVSEYTKIGKDFVVWHGVGLIIHPTAIIGDNVSMRHNTTIGTKRDGEKAPHIGNNVSVGAGVIILGDIEIGDNTTIGAGSVVTKSIPKDAIVVGNPARIIGYNK